MTEASPTLTVELAVGGMTCASCSARLERSLRAREGVVAAEVQLLTERARVQVVPGVTVEAIADAITDAGFEPRLIEPRHNRLRLADEDAQFASISRRDGRLLAVSAALSLPLSMPMLFEPFGLHLGLSPWFELVLATVVQFWLGARFYVVGAKAVRHGSGNMDLLVAMGTSAAYLYSVALLFGGRASGHQMLYFEASAVVITLVRLGKWLESRAKRGTTAALRSLMALEPERVTLRRRGGEAGATLDEVVPLERLIAGHVIVVREGERFAADGIILEGLADVDESMLTGEAEPVTRGPSDRVLTGSLNTNGLVVVQVTEVGENSTLGKIISFVSSAQANKAKVEHLVDRVSQIFVPAVLAIAVVTFVGWWVGSGQFAAALMASVSVLVIACPCALGLATPTAIVAGIGAAAQAGILVRDLDALERAGRIDLVVFDKTGTLTQGVLEVTRIDAEPGRENELLQLAASVEQGSVHPLAKAVKGAAEQRGLPLLELTDFEGRAGSGVRGRVDGRWVLVGSRAWLEQCGLMLRGDDSASVDSHVEVAIDGMHAGTLFLADQLRETARSGLLALHRAGIRTALLSGDRELTVRRFAEALGIGEAEGQVRPEDKGERILEWGRGGRRVMMVGDGINDAPALAQAEVGIAMGSGTQVAVQTAQVVLMRPDLTLVWSTIEVARATFSKIRQNLFWAFIYNCVAIPLAAAGRLSPMVAGLAMALSSVSVVSNSLLLRRWRPRPHSLASRAS